MPLVDFWAGGSGVAHSGTTPIVYGLTRMVGLHLGATQTSVPGVGSRILTVYGTDSEAFSCSDLPFGANTVFVTGVVYRDTDKDKDYSPGRG